MKLPLTSERLTLRRFRQADLPEFVRYRQQPEVARLQTWDESYSLAEATAFLAHQQQLEPDQPDTWLQLVIEKTATAEQLGDVAIHTLADSRQVEVGYTLAKEQQGQGYMREALGCVLDALFASSKHRVTATTDPRNKASIRLLESLGFRLEAHFIKSMWFKGDWVDDYVFAMLRDEWRR